MITAIVNFLIVAFVCFLVIKAYNKMKDEVAEDAGPSEVDLLIEIRDELRSGRPELSVRRRDARRLPRPALNRGCSVEP